MGVSLNAGTPKSSILIGISMINHPFWGTPIFGNTHIYPKQPRVFFIAHLSNWWHFTGKAGMVFVQMNSQMLIFDDLGQQIYILYI